MEKSNQIQIGMLGVIILMLLFMLFKGGFGSAATDGASKSSRDAARTNLQNSITNNNAAATPAAKPAAPAKPVGPLTSLKFNESKFDFGNLTAGEKANHTFKFKNTGKHPLTISNAKGSCGCTVPEWPKEPIMPGKTGEIKVAYDSKNKSGKQSKTVTITANTEPANTTLTISADVAPDPNAPAPATPTPTVTPSITPVAPGGGK